MIKRLIAIVLLIPCIAFAGVQKVCINKVDKHGKPQQVCKLMKKHVKHNGTRVPLKGNK